VFLVFLIKCHLGDQIKEDEMGRACGTHESKGKYTQCLVENLKERDIDLDVDGRILLNCILKKQYG
jgi:hypothetical protein